MTFGPSADGVKASLPIYERNTVLVSENRPYQGIRANPGGPDGSGRAWQRYGFPTLICANICEYACY